MFAIYLSCWRKVSSSYDIHHGQSTMDFLTWLLDHFPHIQMSDIVSEYLLENLLTVMLSQKDCIHNNPVELCLKLDQQGAKSHSTILSPVNFQFDPTGILVSVSIMNPANS